jgi:hypothetical protein
MPISSTYYLDGASLSAATAVFDDPLLTTCAADGYYSDGTLVRQQVGCVLVTEEICPTCLIPYTSSTEPFPNSEGVCGQEMPTTYYTSSVTPTLIIGDSVYQDSLGSNILQDGWYITPTETPECPLAYEVSGGIVVNTFNCCASLLPYDSSVDPLPEFRGVCAQEIVIVYYTNSATLPYLTAGDLVYQDSGGTTPLLDGWYVMPYTFGCNLSYEVSGGIVISTYNCCA